MAESTSPLRIAWYALPRATVPEEQARQKVSFGPVIPNFSPMALEHAFGIIIDTTKGLNRAGARSLLRICPMRPR
jgi:hypothetical protein